MRYILPIILLFLYGCTDKPTPQSDKEVQAKTTIEENIDNAQKAREEYLALQAKRAKEASL